MYNLQQEKKIIKKGPKYLGLFCYICMEKELIEIMKKYPDYKIKGMMYAESNNSWGWLANIYVNHNKKCIELMFGYLF